MSVAYPIILAAVDVARLSGRVAAMEVMRDAFRSPGGGTAVQPPQTLTLLPQDAGDFITYLGVLAEAKVFGAKLSPYLSRPGGGLVTAWTVLMSMETGQPIRPRVTPRWDRYHPRIRHEDRPFCRRTMDERQRDEVPL